MSNLYYEQLERECDPELLHLHLSKYEAALLYIALSSWDAPGVRDMNNQITKFLHAKGILKENELDDPRTETTFINEGSAIEPNYVCGSCGARLLDYVVTSEWVWCTNQPPKFCPNCGRQWKE